MSYVIDYYERDGRKSIADSNVVCDSLGEVVEHVMSCTSDALDEVAPRPAISLVGEGTELPERELTDDARSKLDTITEQVKFWAINDWTENVHLILPNGDAMDVTKAAYAGPDRVVVIGDGDGDIDALIASALASVQWVIDDLRSWESNTESAKYNADKLADAMTVIRARLSHKAGS